MQVLAFYRFIVDKTVETNLSVKYFSYALELCYSLISLLFNMFSFEALDCMDFYLENSISVFDAGEASIKSVLPYK